VIDNQGYTKVRLSSGNDRYLREGDDRSRRTADIADRRLYVAIGAGSRPTRVASRRAGLRTKAALPLRARKVDFTEGLNLTSSCLKSAFDNWNSHARLLHW